MLNKLLWANIILKIIDVSTTGYAIKNISLSVERNPIVKSLAEFCGVDLALLLILLLHSLLVYSLYRKKSTRALVFVFILLLGVATNNIFWIISHAQ